MSSPIPPPPPPAPKATPTVAAKKSGVPKVAILVAAVVLGALAVTALSSRGSKSTSTAVTTVAGSAGTNRPGTINALPPTPGETQPVTVTGASLVDLPEKGDDLALGQKAPTIAGRDFLGKPVVITPGDGKPKLMLFVAHWCPHCQREVPLVTKWYNDGSIPKTVDLVAVSTAYKASQGNPPSQWLAKVGWPGIVVADDDKSTAGLAYGLTAFPFFTLVDANGNVVARASGELELATIQELLAKLGS